MSRRALVVDGTGSIGLEERARLRPKPGEVVARPAYCGLCGTDLELLRGEVDPAFVRYPLAIGHEWSGLVEAVGEGVTGIEPGMRCVAEGIIPCGTCTSCRAGATNVCETYDEVGFTREGAAGDQVAVPARVVHRLEDGVPLLDAALVEPAAVVLTGLEKARPRQGVRLLVVGDGTIALLAVLLAGLWSPAEVVVAGRRNEQEELALSLGATRFTTGAAPSGFDLAVEAAGVPAAAETAVRSLRRGGTALLLGIPPAGSTVTLPADMLVNDDLSIVASFGYTSTAWTRVVGLLNAGRFRPGRLVTHRFALADFERAFAELAAPSGTRGKVMLELGGG
ncbi:MAG: zinc-dependent alcohol dehydrogenase [Gaiellaceae bacterium]